MVPPGGPRDDDGEHDGGGQSPDAQRNACAVALLTASGRGRLGPDAPSSRVNGAFETSPNTATLSRAECDARRPVALPPSSGTPNDGSTLLRGWLRDEAPLAPKASDTVETSFDRRTRARVRQRCRIGVRRDASR